MRPESSVFAEPTARAVRWSVVVVVAVVLLHLPVQAVWGQDLLYTFSGVVRVLDISSPPPGFGPPIPGLDPLGLDGAAVLLTCQIDPTTPPSLTGTNGDGQFAFYNAGLATLAITGSTSGGVDGTYVDTPCSVRVDDFPVGSTFGGDSLSVTTSWDLGLPFPDVFQVPFALLGESTFSGIGLQPFAASEVVAFIGVNFAGSSDVFYFESGTGIATGVVLLLSPSQRIGDLIEAVEMIPGLNRGQKRSLVAKLENARRLLDVGRERPAMRLLSAFVRRVLALVRSGHLEVEEGQPLIDEANAIIEQILSG